MMLLPAGAAARSPATRRAMTAVMLGAITADQAAKALADAGVIRGSAGWVSVAVTANRGAAGGSGSADPVLVTLAVAAVTAVIVVVALRARARGTALCLALMGGGAAGNLADRLFRSPGLGRGGVVDWIRLSSGASFDLADLMIVLGAAGVAVALAAACHRAARRRLRAWRGGGRGLGDVRGGRRRRDRGDAVTRRWRRQQRRRRPAGNRAAAA